MGDQGLGQEREGGREGGQGRAQEGEEEEGIRSQIFSTHGEEVEELQLERGLGARRARGGLPTRSLSRPGVRGEEGEGARLVGEGLGACRGWEGLTRAW